MVLRLASAGLLWAAAGLLAGTHAERVHFRLRTNSSSAERQDAPVYGDRKPWEDGRQDAYSRDIRTEPWFTKIWWTYNNSQAAAPGDAFAKPLCGTLEAAAETTRGGQWYADAHSGHVWWEPRSCRLRRLSGPEARQCLSFRHLFFAGDSITRYQYVTLAAFLSKGANQLAWGHGEEKAVAMETEWGSWDEYFSSGSRLMEARAVDGTAHEDCNCSHIRKKWHDGKEVDDKEAVREHRSFTLKDFATVGGNQTGNILRLTHRLVYNLPTKLQAGVDALDFGLRMLPQQNSMPDAVVMNQGIWMGEAELSDQEHRDRFEAILGHGASILQQLPGRMRPRLLWKTTTVTTKAAVEEEEWARVNVAAQHVATASPAWQLLDVRALTQQALDQGLDLYGFDPIHFAPQVYQEFNDLLLNVLCAPSLEFQTAALHSSSGR